MIKTQRIWITKQRKDTLKQAIDQGLIAIGCTKRDSQNSVYDWDVATNDIDNLDLETFQVLLIEG